MGLLRIQMQGVGRVLDVDAAVVVMRAYPGGRGHPLWHQQPQILVAAPVAQVDVLVDVPVSGVLGQFRIPATGTVHRDAGHRDGRGRGDRQIREGEVGRIEECGLELVVQVRRHHRLEVIEQFLILELTRAFRGAAEQGLDETAPVGRDIEDVAAGVHDEEDRHDALEQQIALAAVILDDVGEVAAEDGIRQCILHCVVVADGLLVVLPVAGLAQEDQIQQGLAHPCGAFVHQIHEAVDRLEVAEHGEDEALHGLLVAVVRHADLAVVPHHLEHAAAGDEILVGMLVQQVNGLLRGLARVHHGLGQGVVAHIVDLAQEQVGDEAVLQRQIEGVLAEAGVIGHGMGELVAQAPALAGQAVHQPCHALVVLGQQHELAGDLVVEHHDLEHLGHEPVLEPSREGVGHHLVGLEAPQEGKLGEVEVGARDLHLAHHLARDAKRDLHHLHEAVLGQVEGDDDHAGGHDLAEVDHHLHGLAHDLHGADEHVHADAHHVAHHVEHATHHADAGLYPVDRVEYAEAEGLGRTGGHCARQGQGNAGGDGSQAQAADAI